MPKQVVNGAVLQCSFGTAPSSLGVLPTNMDNVDGMPAANIMDFKPLVNIKPFGMCASIANPAVSTATTAASGVLTPQPCIPNTIAPWFPGSPKVMIGKMPALNNTSTCMCFYGGVISVSYAGQVTTDIP